MLLEHLQLKSKLQILTTTPMLWLLALQLVQAVAVLAVLFQTEEPLVVALKHEQEQLR